MTLRLRYHALFLSLFAGLALANAVLYHFIARAETEWGLAEQSRGYAICLAEFLASDSDLSPTTRARLQPALLRLGQTGELGLSLFSAHGDNWRHEALLDQPERPAPPPPSAPILATLQAGQPGATITPLTGADADLACGYAPIRSADGKVRAFVGVAAHDTSLRRRMAAVHRAGALYLGLALLIGCVAAEILTRATRHGIARLERDAATLAAGDYAGTWAPMRVAEINDLGHTLRSIGDILQEGGRQTRRRFVQAELLPRREDTVADCRELCDAAPPPSGIAPHVVVRRIDQGSADDFWGLRASPDSWCLVAGRLDPPPSGTDPLDRLIRAAAARDLLLGTSLHASSDQEPWSRFAAVFPCAQGQCLSGHAAGPQHLHTFATGASPATSRRGALGTLAPDSLALAHDYLRQFPDQPLGEAGEKLAAILAGRDRGLLILYESTPPSR